MRWLSDVLRGLAYLTATCIPQAKISHMARPDDKGKEHISPHPHPRQAQQVT